MTTEVETSILVNRPVSIVYNQWTQFEEFPAFMEGVEEVEQRDDVHLHWVAEIAGVKRQWEATILEQVPDTTIAWAATEGATNAGAVHFIPQGPEQTTVRLHLEYDPDGWLAGVADRLGMIERRAKGDLERFKQFIESEQYATGAWRGAVNPGLDVGTPGVETARLAEGDKGGAGVTASAAATAAAVVAGAAGVAAGRRVVGRVRDAKEQADAEPEPTTADEHSHDDWIGKTVRDRDGDEVGPVTDIFYDDVTGQPEWLTVSTGWFGTKDSFVPIAGTALTGDDITVDFPTEVIKQAPTRGRDTHLDEDEEERLYRHYGFDTAGTDYPSRFGDRDRADEGYRLEELRSDEAEHAPGSSGRVLRPYVAAGRLGSERTGGTDRPGPDRTP